MLVDFIELSRYFGANILYIQGSGGNTSFKNNATEMYVKASGFFMKDIDEKTGYVVLEYSKIKAYLEQTNVASDRLDNTLDDRLNKEIDRHVLWQTDRKQKASIESSMHALLRKFVLHTHPVFINVLLCMKRGRDLIEDLYKDQEFIFIDYYPPGFYLAKSIAKELCDYKELQEAPNVIFLQNHGLIVHGSTSKNAAEITDLLNARATDYLRKKNAYIDFAPLADLESVVDEDDIFPDTVVFKRFLGQNLDQLEASKKQAILETYSASHHIILTINRLQEEVAYLKKHDVKYIENMSREKHRQEQIED